MTQTAAPETTRSTTPSTTSRPNAWHRFSRGQLHSRLAGITRGALRIEEAWDPSGATFGEVDEAYPTVTMTIADPATYSAIVARGSLGAAESYMDGTWTCDDLTGLMRLMVRNREVLEGLESGIARLAVPALKLMHRLNNNTRTGSKRNIAAHYDLGNDFFALFLDPTMTYSSGIFETPTATMEEASIAKIDRLCRKLDLQPHDHLLEIGTGWGSLAIHAAQTYGCRVTTTTISKEQWALASERVAAAGLADRVTLLQSDYRDLEGQYDKLVSVEMVEAVGHQFLGTWLAQCSRLLKPTGMMAMQAITMPDQHYAQALREVDFIKRYIFPGSFIPSVAAITAATAKSTDLKLSHLEDFGLHYAETLHRWRAAMTDNLTAIRALGLGPEFLRMWEYYFCYCEGGFAERFISVAQILFTKPRCQRVPILPDLAAPVGRP